MQINHNKFGKVNYNKSDVFSLGLTILRMVTNAEEGSLNAKSTYLQNNIYTTIDEHVKNIKLNGAIKWMLTVDQDKRPKFEVLVHAFNADEATIIDT